MRNKLVISAPFFRQCCDLLGLTPFTQRLFEGDPVSWPTSGIPDQIDDLCRRMHEEYSRLHACSDAFLTAYLLQILEKIYDGMDSNLSLLSLGGITDQILDFIGRTDLAEFSISAMCDQLHVSKFYACHRFRDAVGLTTMGLHRSAQAVQSQNPAGRKHPVHCGDCRPTRVRLSLVIQPRVQPSGGLHPQRLSPHAPLILQSNAGIRFRKPGVPARRLCMISFI